MPSVLPANPIPRERQAIAAAERPQENLMYKEPKSLNRHHDTPRDKPQAERVEHGNLIRPGATAHPQARGWRCDAAAAWPRG